MIQGLLLGAFKKRTKILAEFIFLNPQLGLNFNAVLREYVGQCPKGHFKVFGWFLDLEPDTPGFLLLC